MENFYHLTKNGKKLYILILDNENIKAFIYFKKQFYLNIHEYII